MNYKISCNDGSIYSINANFVEVKDWTIVFYDEDIIMPIAIIDATRVNNIMSVMPFGPIHQLKEADEK